MGLGGRLLDETEGADDGRGKALVADTEMFEGALGLRAPVAVDRDLYGSHAVALESELHGRTPFSDASSNLPTVHSGPADHAGGPATVISAQCSTWSSNNMIVSSGCATPSRLNRAGSPGDPRRTAR